MKTDANYKNSRNPMTPVKVVTKTAADTAGSIPNLPRSNGIPAPANHHVAGNEFVSGNDGREGPSWTVAPGAGVRRLEGLF